MGRLLSTSSALNLELEVLLQSMRSQDGSLLVAHSKKRAICEPKSPLLDMDRIRVKVGMDCALIAEEIYFSYVHAKCTAHERESLWAQLLRDKPETRLWVLVGDFNVIVSAEEKRGGLPFKQSEGVELSQFMSLTEVGDAGFSGSKYTWCNNRQGMARVWKMLDRLLLNSAAMKLKNTVVVQHLGRDPSDHAPLLLSTVTRLNGKPVPFRFLNVWVAKSGFLDVVKESWSTVFTGSPFTVLLGKLQRVKQALRQCNLQEARARLRNALVVEEEFWRQKAHVKWLCDGDRNTRFFQAVVTERRRKSVIHRIRKSDGVWVDDESSICNEAVNFFQTLFTEDGGMTSSDMLEVIPRLLTETDNGMAPSLQEVKDVIFSMGGKSAAGPNGFTSRFSQPPGRFSEKWIDMIWRPISNVWLSMIVNGLPHEFFKSTRGLRQGDPLSPALFIIGAEVISRSLNALAKHKKFKPFRTPSGFPMVTHLAFADDVVIFTSGLKASIQLVKKVVDGYCLVSGQRLPLVYCPRSIGCFLRRQSDIVEERLVVHAYPLVSSSVSSKRSFRVTRKGDGRLLVEFARGWP
ncbi:uncharacterized protein [Coffea arabica]|uniref:Reverse transcriptase domain-containing protein n=1 Tax=Coffea arabica TaxID=13443 RepID=A0ABM4WMZ3_COFAR